MAVQAVTTSAPLTPLRRPGTRTFRHALRHWYIARQTRRALSQLSDRELADIGVTRDRIAEVADRVARQ